MEVIAPSSTIVSDPCDAVAASRARVRCCADALLVILFLAGLCAPLLGVQVRSHGWDIASRSENRKMADEPALFGLHDSPSMSTRAKLRAIVKFPGQFKYYLSEHFGFRSLLIRAHGTLMVNGLGMSDSPAVVLGKEGWLYLANDNSVEDYRRSDPFTPEQLAQWRSLLEARHNFCAQRGIIYLFVVAPSKHDIYPEYMPDRLTRVGPECRLDQLLDSLHESHSPVHVVDLRKDLLDAKSSGVRLYHKTDTHWNDRGGWIAYQSIMAQVRAGLPAAAGLKLDDFDAVATSQPGMDLAGLLGLSDVVQEESLNLVPRIRLRLPHVAQGMVDPITVQADGSSKPRVVVFRDSFLTAILPFVAESFSRGVYLWEDGFDRTVIDAERPDIVIQEIAQRKLMLPVALMDKTQPVRLENRAWQLNGPAR